MIVKFQPCSLFEKAILSPHDVRV
uniref:Uncharacterized protein n=1 Tax=Rhizophora mucronata TaxID=61149 RepID=A0A2P2NGH1_RHIMU